MEALVVPEEPQSRNRLECRNGWFRFVFPGKSSEPLSEPSECDGNAAGYRISRFQTISGLIHYALFRGAAFTEEIGDSPSDQVLEQCAYWNDCLLLSYDRAEDSWQILCNRAASIPVFWTVAENQTIVSNNMEWLGGESGQIDQVAFAETLLWDVPLRERTLRRAIKQLPAGYCLHIAPSGVRAQRKFVLNIRPSSEAAPTSSTALIEQGVLLNVRAVHRAIVPDLPMILPISGGLDSRCILGSIPKELTSACSTVSFGHPGALELRFGRSVAAQCGASWRKYELDSAHYTGTRLPDSVRAGCGMTPIQHLHLSCALRQFSSTQSQLLIGFMGDPVAGADSQEKSSAADADSAVASMFAKAGVTPGLASELFGKHTVNAIVDDLHSVYYDAISENPADAFLEYYFIVERQSKLVTHIFNHLHWAGHLLGFPFMDGEWARFFLSLPPVMRADRSLFQMTLAAQRPDLARIPSTAGFAPFAAPSLTRSCASRFARNWNRACTASQRITGYRLSLPNPFATELQGVMLRGPLRNQLTQSIDKLRAAGLASSSLAGFLMSQRSLHHPWIGFRTITAALCLEETTR